MAQYDLAGNLTWLKYPSGREVTFSYDAASRLNQVRFDSFNGTPVGYHYLSSATYHPHGAPHVTTLGSGLVETNTYNNRLQPLQMTGVTGAFTYFNKHYNFHDASGRNNGNVMRIADQLNAGRSQNFSYDELNRLDQAYTDANSGADCWGLDHGYDIWANLLSASVTKCTAPMLSLGVNTQNRITNAGFSYDTAGNLTADGSHSYQWDAESRMKSLDATGATYTYDASGNRVRKQVGSDSTEYIYFAGQVIAERNTAGEWSDYIFASGRRLAKADTFEDRIHVWGTNCASCGWQWTAFNFPNAAGYSGYVLQPGDKLYFRQWQTNGTRGGMLLWFADGTNSAWGPVYDQDGLYMNDDTAQQWWHYRRVDLSAFAGKVVSGIGLIIDGNSSAGLREIYYQDIALVSADGTTRPIYNRQTSITLEIQGTGGVSGRGYEVNHLVGSWPEETVGYYHGDHLGSSRMTSSANGYPTWSATYLPFGQEHNPQPTTNHYKFTGKERDPESNLDYFIARYYSSAMGRYLSPDWSETPQPVPYADFNNPQTLNLYAYVANNPLNSTDPDGHCPDFLSCVTQVVVGAAQGVGNFATNVVSGLLTPATLSNGEIATRPSEVTQALAEGVAQSVVTAAQDYASGQAAASFNALDAQGQMAVVTEGVLTGASAVATAAKGSPSAKPTPPGENAAAAAGRAADAALAAKVRGKPGWQSQPTIKGPNGETLRPDALTKSGRPLEQKPNTPSGHKRGATQLRKYEAATGKKGRVIYYDPEKYKKQ